MSRYDGLIIPRSYSEYINKTDAATLLQALQLSGVMDATPTADSVHPVKSGGIYSALAGKQPALTFDDVPTDGSDNPVKSNGIYDALAEKQDTLTFDNTPTENSDNPVKSGGINTALKNIFETKGVATSGSNADDFYCGFIRAGDYVCSNLPTSRETSSGQIYYTVFTARQNNDPQNTTWLQGIQIAIATSARANKTYTRVVNGNNGWSSWQQL